MKSSVKSPAPLVKLVMPRTPVAFTAIPLWVREAAPRGKPGASAHTPSTPRVYLRRVLPLVAEKSPTQMVASSWNTMEPKDVMVASVRPGKAT